MSTFNTLQQLICDIAATNNDPIGRLIRNCPVIQAVLLKQKKMSLDDLSDGDIEKLMEHTFLEDWIDGQDVMRLLHISPRTLQTLRSNGILPYSRINNKIYYLRQDIQKILADNYLINKIHFDYGKKRN